MRDNSVQMRAENWTRSMHVQNVTVTMTEAYNLATTINFAEYNTGFLIEASHAQLQSLTCNDLQVSKE